MERGGCVYIITNYTKTVLHVGVTSDLFSMIYEHVTGKYPNSFSSKYQLKHCVYYEFYQLLKMQLEDRNRSKKWRREKKEELINSIHMSWADLWDEIRIW